MKFKRLYQYQIEKEIKDDKIVWFVDKQKREIGCVNEALLKDFFEMTNSKNEDRFDFWIEVKENVQPN